MTSAAEGGCCSYLVDGGCAHRTAGDHHHAPNRHVTGTQGTAVPLTREQRLELAVAGIRVLVATWVVDDNTYLHLDGQDLGYADAAVQIAAIMDTLS